MSWAGKQPFYRFDTKSNRENIKSKRMNVNGTIYTYEEVKRNVDIWKEQYRKHNGTDELQKDGLIDRSYQRYCAELDAFLKETDDETLPKM